MTEKMTTAEIVFTAITWAEESMLQMVGGCHESDPYRAEVLDQLKQIRAYKRRRFGKPADPFKDAKLVSIFDLKPNTNVT